MLFFFFVLSWLRLFSLPLLLVSLFNWLSVVRFGVVKIDVLTLCFCDGRDFKSSLSAVFKANYLTRDNVRNFPYIYIKILFAVGDGWNSEQVKQIIGSGWHIRTVIALRAGLIQSVIRHNYNQYELTPFGKVLHDLLLKEFRRLELEFKQKFDDLEGFDIYLPENKYK